MGATKELGGAEDLLLGQGTIQQSRGGNSVPITKMNAGVIPYIGDPGDVGYKSIKDILDATDPNIIEENTRNIEQNTSDIGDNLVELNSTTSIANANALTIANLATAQAAVENSIIPAVAAISTTPTILYFDIVTDTSDSNIMTFDASANTMTFKQDASFNFASTLNFSSTTNFPSTIIFRLVDVSDNAVLLVQEVLLDIPTGKSSSFTINTLFTVGKNGIPSSDLTIRVEIIADVAGYVLESFSSIIASSSAYGAGVIIDNLTSTSATTSLSANQGRLLNEKIISGIASSTVGGTVKVRLGGTNLYLTFDGTDA